MLFSQTELLVQAQLTREFAALSPSLQSDFRRILETAPRLLEELMKVTDLLFNLIYLTRLNACAFFKSAPSSANRYHYQKLHQ